MCGVLALAGVHKQGRRWLRGAFKMIDLQAWKRYGRLRTIALTTMACTAATELVGAPAGACPAARSYLRIGRSCKMASSARHVEQTRRVATCVSAASTAPRRAHQRAVARAASHVESHCARESDLSVHRLLQPPLTPRLYDLASAFSAARTASTRRRSRAARVRSELRHNVSYVQMLLRVRLLSLCALHAIRRSVLCSSVSRQLNCLNAGDPLAPGTSSQHSGCTPTSSHACHQGRCRVYVCGRACVSGSPTACVFVRLTSGKPDFRVVGAAEFRASDTPRARTGTERARLLGGALQCVLQARARCRCELRAPCT